jgi:hypothetical protein
MPKIVKKYGKITLILGLISAILGLYIGIPTAEADNGLPNREVKISDSRPSQTSVTYDVEADHSANTVKCLEIQFCTTATGSCTAPTGMDASGGARDDSHWSGWTASAWTGAFAANKIQYYNTTGATGGNDYSFSTSGVTNPSSAATYYGRITTYNPSSCTGAADCCATTTVDTGVVAFAIVSGVTVSATIAEYLTFTITDSAIGMGTWSAGSTAVRFANADETGDTAEQGVGLPTQLQVSSNAGGGLTITLHDVGNGSGSAGLYKSTATTKLIAATAANSVTAGSESYAVYGKNASGLTIATGFNGGTSTGVMTTSPQTFASATGAVSSAYVDAQPKAAIAGTTPAGSYSDTLIFIATPTY